MDILITFLTIVAYVWGGFCALASLVGVIGLFSRGRVAALGILLWAVPSGIIPWAFLLARHLTK